MDNLLQFGNGLKLYTPGELSNITDYVLREQGDWFESEIHFVRAMLQRGMIAVDIGANHGVYTLSMARAVGPTGGVHAFEPASRTASYLRRSVEVNRFANVRIIQAALSDSAGSAKLYKPAASELNSLVNNSGQEVDFEDVATITLDTYVEANSIERIDFIKLDAEGHEMQVLAGATGVLSRFSPLIMIEVTNGHEVNLEPARKLLGCGYSFFRHVPGLNILAPVKIDGDAVVAQLNLFACKPDMAQRLLAAGCLADESNVQLGKPMPVPAKEDLWPDRLLRHPYGKRLGNIWHKRLAGHDHRPTVYALGLFARSQNRALSASERYACLLGSFEILKSISQQKPAFLRDLSLARVAAELGYKQVSTGALSRLWTLIRSHQEVLPIEPFLAPEAWFDNVDPRENLGNWIGGATLHALEKFASYSSAFSGQQSLDRLNLIRQFGFVSPEMKRRSRLIQERFSMSG